MQNIKFTGWLILISIAICGCQKKNPTFNFKDDKMNDKYIQIMETSKSSKELRRASIQLAKSDEEAEHRKLQSFLTSDDFLHRLDNEEEYDGLPRDLRLASVIKILIDNDSKYGKETLLFLTQSKVFRDHPNRIDLLIDAWGEIRPSPPQAIAFWDKYSCPNDGHVHRTIMRITQNSSQPALKLFQQKILDPIHPDTDKIYWFRRHIVPKRDNRDMLACCHQLLIQELKPELQSHLVEILFDHKPKIWYGADDWPDIADIRNSNPEGLRILYEIGKFALDNVDLTDSLKEIIQHYINEYENENNL